MRIVLDYNLVRAALLAATLTLAVLTLFGVHPAFAGDPIGSTPH